MTTTNLLIEQTLRLHYHTRPYFIGVFNKDDMPEILPMVPSFMIVSSTNSSEINGHWLGLIFPNHHQAEFFDSFGKSPSLYGVEFTDKLTQNSIKGYTYSDIPVQDTKSSACGLFCMYICDKRTLFPSLASVVTTLASDDLLLNDIIVTNYFENHLNM